MLETKKIGGKIAAARKKKNISQSQLAERLFVSPQAVGKWERGESMPDIVTFGRLAEILGVDLNYFAGSFPSEAVGAKPVEPVETETTDLPAGERNVKLSWDMSRGNWEEADFSGLRNLKDRFSSSNMQRCKFNGSDLSGLILKFNNVGNCDFSGSEISNSNIRGSNLSKNVFKDCLLKGTEFLGSNIERCDFTGADLTGSKFARSMLYACNFTGTDFTGVEIRSGGFTGEKSKDPNANAIIGAKWNHTSFIKTQIADLIFSGTLDDCYFENCEFTRVIFREATLVNTFFKNNEKLKKIGFIGCKADRITLEFLKQGKANLSGITLLTPYGEGE
jgi:uncharacterized protein YjbI with pentapeptide repeats